MVQYRDIILKRQAREARKQDKLPFKRAVLTTEGGVQTATADPFSEVWASESERRVWHMVDGAVQPAQVLCRKVSDPYVGLGVIIGYADGSNQLEVLADDFFLTGTGDPTGWASSSPRDLEPGGRKQLWIYTKVIVPLATYPGTGVAVNVINGDYPYLGTRKSFAGSSEYDLSGSVPGAGLCRYTGLYLDSANTLQVIDGATTTAGSTPAEPTWPAGAFRLCVVLLTDGDTSIDFSSILDRRMAWSDEQGGKSWPFANILTVSSTDPDADYPTIGAAITAASAGDVILLDAETYTETLTISKNLSLVSLSPSGATITTAGNDATTLTVTTGTVFLGNLTVTNTGAGTNSYALKITGGTTRALLCDFVKSSGVPTNSYGAKIEGGTNTFYDCYSAALTGTNAYGLYADTGPSDTSYFNGIIRGDTFDVTTNNAGVNLFIHHAELYTATREYNNAAGNLLGEFYSQAGNLLTINGTGLSAGVWLTDESAILRKKYATLATAVTNAASGDSIKLDTDTYSISATQNIDVSLTIEGDGPEATIIDCTGSNITAFDITTNSIAVTFKDLTIKHTGGGVAATGIFSNNTGVTVILDNCKIEISSGAPTTGRGLWIESGTWTLRNGSKITITSGTSKYGIYNDSAATTITVGADCTLDGATDDVYGDQAGSTITLDGAILTNNLISWAGTLAGRWFNSSGVLYAPESNDTFSPLTFRPGYIIVPSVASNNLTVALKTLDSNDASAASPIVVRVGDVVRTITTSLSTTKNAGTNWFNSGGAELATKDVDYFVYLVQETGASAGTKIGFSRVPWGQTVGDFSSTTTNEKYLAGPTNYNATDVVELIGRFNATLSAGAGYTWSIGTAVVINRPIFETRFLTWVPTVSSLTGTITTVGTVTASYAIIGREFHGLVTITVTTNGTGATALQNTLPFTPNGNLVWPGRCTSSGKTVAGFGSTTTMSWVNYDNSYPMASGETLIGGGFYRIG